MSLMFEVIAAGDTVPADGLDALSHDDFEAAFRRLLDIEGTVAALKLAWLDSARRRATHRQHGFRDTAAWVASLAGERTGSVRRDVALVERLAATRVVAEAPSSGAVSKTQAGVLVGGRQLPADVQAELVERADELPVHQLGQAVRRAQHDHGLVPTDPLPSVSLAQTDGGTLDATFDAEGYEVLTRAIHAVVGHMGLPTDVPIGHRRALALVELGRFYLERAEAAPANRVGVNHVLLLLDHETLLADTGGSAVLSSGAVISGDIARRIACDAGISRIITRGRSEVLDVGRATRSISPAMAKAVIARDRHCTHPGCTAPPWLCEIHHEVPWALGGRTRLHDLELTCRHHHRLVHAHDPTAHRRRTDAA